MEWIAFWLAVVCFAVSFVGAGTAKTAENIKWARRFGIAGVLAGIVGIVLLIGIL